MANNKEPYILLTLYSNLYEVKYNKKPTINRYKEKWAMQDVLDSIGFDRTKKVMEYYFKVNKNGHPLMFFYHNFDRLEDMMIRIENDRKNRGILLEKTKRLVEEE